MLPVGDLADFARRGQAVEHRHLHVHQNGVVVAGLHLVDRNASVVGDVHLQPHFVKEGGGHLLIEQVVFDQQNAGALQGRLLLRVQVRFGPGDCHTLQLFCCQGVHDSIKQQRGIEWLGQDVLDARLLCGLVDFLAAMGRDHDHVWPCDQGQPADFVGGCNAVHARHLPVEKNDFVRFLCC